MSMKPPERAPRPTEFEGLRVGALLLDLGWQKGDTPVVWQPNRPGSVPRLGTVHTDSDNVEEQTVWLHFPDFATIGVARDEVWVLEPPFERYQRVVVDTGHGPRPGDWRVNSCRFDFERRKWMIEVQESVAGRKPVTFAASVVSVKEPDAWELNDARFGVPRGTSERVIAGIRRRAGWHGTSEPSQEVWQAAERMLMAFIRAPSDEE